MESVLMVDLGLGMNSAGGLYAELTRSLGKADIGLSIASRFYRLSMKSYTAMVNSPIRGPARDAYDPPHNNAGGRS